MGPGWHHVAWRSATGAICRPLSFRNCRGRGRREPPLRPQKTSLVHLADQLVMAASWWRDWRGWENIDEWRHFSLLPTYWRLKKISFCF